MDSSDDVDGALREVYAATVLEITSPAGGRIVVTPATSTRTAGGWLAGRDHVHVITAANPRSRRLDDGQNAERNRRLERDLRAAGMEATPAVGRSPDGSWAEPSFAVYDADEEAVLRLARAHEQHAVFRWTAQELAVVSAEGRTLSSRGWRATT